jgi:trehalose-phosphatase
MEVKGLAVAFHFRGRADERAAVRELDAIAESAREEGLVARYGRKILEVLPPVGSHKGTAVRQLLEKHGLRRALAAGDDTTDIDSFAALDGLEVAVRVAVASAEAPQALVGAADLVVDSTDEFLELLRRL